MLVSSKSFPEGTKSSTIQTLVLRHGARHVLVLLPKNFNELLSITRAVFGPAPDSSFVFETSDLSICQDASIEIHPGAWEAIALTVSTVVVKNKDLASPRGEEDIEVPLRPQVGRKTSITPRRGPQTASGSSNGVMRSENSAGATSYDDIADALPTDDLAEEGLGSYDDYINLALAQRKGKGKARVRIESEDEAEDGDEEGYAEALPAAKLPASYRLRNAVEPSFSIVPSSSTPPKRVATSPRTVRGSGGAHGVFSPGKVRSGLTRPAFSDEEGDVKPPSYKPMQVVSDEFPHSAKTPPNATSLKEIQNDDSAVPSKFKPQLKVDLATAPAPASTLPNDKILITIRHPPTEKENKFKVKTTHTVGRVLSSACVAFGLNPNGASLMHWSEEDGVETSYRCGNDLSMGSIAVDGTIFIIQLAT